VGAAGARAVGRRGAEGGLREVRGGARGQLLRPAVAARAPVAGTARRGAGAVRAQGRGAHRRRPGDAGGPDPRAARRGRARVPVAAPRAGGRDRLRALGARLRRAGGAVRRPVRRPGPGHAPGGAARARGGGRGLARLEPAQATTRPVRRDPVMAPAGGGRLVRGGRVVARVLLVWVLAVGALRLLDEWLVGFAMPQWWQPTVCALLFGLLSAVVWPLVLRVALPVAVFTLGIGSFLLLGAGVLAISFAVPGVVVTDLGTAVVVAVAVAARGSVVSSVVG